MSAPSPSRPSRPLFEQVVDGLYRGDLPGLECAQPLLAPSDRGPQGDAVVTELSLRLQILQRLERLVRGDRLHTGVVQLVEVDPIRAQAAQARLERLAHKWSVPALGPLALRVLTAPHQLEPRAQVPNPISDAWRSVFPKRRLRTRSV